jgi:DNA-binding CsgD family transcriptional regulator
LLFSPKHIGMFLLGCLILCLPHFEKKNSPSDWRAIFKNNAMMAGGLETFMLIFAGMSRKGLMPADVFAEIALGMRPLFYGFICYAVLRDGEGRRGGEGQKERKAAGDKTQGAAAVPKHDFSSLTRQEKCVAELIARGLTNREIGEELCISETTVKKHVSNIFEKLGISSRRELR